MEVIGEWIKWVFLGYCSQYNNMWFLVYLIVVSILENYDFGVDYDFKLVDVEFD